METQLKDLHSNNSKFSKLVSSLMETMKFKNISNLKMLQNLLNIESQKIFERYYYFQF